MLSKQTIYIIQSGTQEEAYTFTTNAALFIATGGFLNQANQLLSVLWKYKLPHDRNTWLADMAFTLLWHTAQCWPDYIPFETASIDSIEKDMPSYIAMDKWGQHMADIPWQERTGYDLLRIALVTASMVRADGTRPQGMNALIARGQHLPPTASELEALSMLEKWADEGGTSHDGLALGAELAAKNYKPELATRFARSWATGYHESYSNYIFPLLASGRHVAPLLLQHIVASELKLSTLNIQDFLAEAIPTIDRRFTQGRSLIFGDLSWRELLQRLSRTAIDLEGEALFDKEVSESGWVGFAGAATEEISQTEDRLDLTLPEDYRQFLETTNGHRKFSQTDSALLPVGQLDLLKNVLDPDHFDILTTYVTEENDPETMEEYLSRAILISQEPDEQMVFMLPPSVESPTWQTWFWASWNLGRTVYPSFRHYMETRLQYLLDY